LLDLHKLPPTAFRASDHKANGRRIQASTAGGEPIEMRAGPEGI
jgi:hypothetical protein